MKGELCNRARATDHLNTAVIDYQFRSESACIRIHFARESTRACVCGHYLILWLTLTNWQENAASRSSVGQGSGREVQSLARRARPFDQKVHWRVRFEICAVPIYSSTMSLKR